MADEQADQAELAQAIRESQRRLPPGAGHASSKEQERSELEMALALSLEDHERALAFARENHMEPPPVYHPTSPAIRPRPPTRPLPRLPSSSSQSPSGAQPSPHLSESSSSSSSSSSSHTPSTLSSSCSTDRLDAPSPAAMSSITERTEVPTIITTTHDDQTMMARRPSPTAPWWVQHGRPASAPPPEAASVRSISSQQGATNPVNDLVRGRAFGDGVRFGFPLITPTSAATAATTVTHQPDQPDQASDGLRCIAPFPDVIRLSWPNRRGLDEQVDGPDGQRFARFAIEASTWSTLLRFLMWCVLLISQASMTTSLNSLPCNHRYGETRVEVTTDGEAPVRREADLTAEFRAMPQGGLSCVRLGINLVHVDGTSSSASSSPIDLKSKSTTRASRKFKGKTVAGPRTTTTTVLLPDRLSLPTTLSALAARLFTIRHLSSIAASTLAAKDATLHYHDLRHLGREIEDLASEHGGKEGSAAQDQEAKADELRLIQRLRERLKGRKVTKPEASTSAPTVAVATAAAIATDQLVASGSTATGPETTAAVVMSQEPSSPVLAARAVA